MNISIAKVVTEELRKEGLTVEAITRQSYHQRTFPGKTRAVVAIRERTATFCSLDELAGYLNLSPSSITRIIQTVEI
jgi:DNA-binding MarR family transcriptional regulator